MKKCGSKSQCSIVYISFILAQIPQHPNNKSRRYFDQNTNFKTQISKHKFQILKSKQCLQMNPKNKCSQSHSSQFKSNNKSLTKNVPKIIHPNSKKIKNQKLLLTKTQSPNLEVQTMDLKMNFKNKCFQNHSYNSKPIKKKKKLLLVKTKSFNFEIQNNGCNEPREQVLQKSIIPTQKQQ